MLVAASRFKAGIALGRVVITVAAGERTVPFHRVYSTPPSPLNDFHHIALQHLRCRAVMAKLYADDMFAYNIGRPMNGSKLARFAGPLDVGAVAVANRVFLAP